MSLPRYRMRPSDVGSMPAIDPPECRLAAAGLADQPDDLARGDRRGPPRRPHARSARLMSRRASTAILSAKSSSFVKRLADAFEGRRRRAHVTASTGPVCGLQQRACWPGRHVAHRLRRAARLQRAWTARAERAALRQVQQRRRHAGDLRQRLAAPVAGRHRADQPARVGVNRAARSRRDAGPSSTMRPAYITAIRSARPATTARSWRDPDQRRARLGRELLHLARGSAPGW